MVKVQSLELREILQADLSALLGMRGLCQCSSATVIF